MRKVLLKLEEPALMNLLDAVPYIVDGIDVVAKVEEQKKLQNYEFGCLLTTSSILAKKREMAPSRAGSPPSYGENCEIRMNNVELSSEVDNWLNQLDNESIENLEVAFAKLTITILQAHPPIKDDLKYVLRMYENLYAIDLLLHYSLCIKKNIYLCRT